MIVNMAAGGGIGALSAYAVIGVTYPSGSTCTCTLGSVVYTAKDTSGYALFGVPSNGTYTVRIVKGSDSATATAVINTKYQNVNLVMSF